MPRELLVIDDEPDACRLLKTFFETKGFHVATADSVQTAMDRLSAASADVVLLDLCLPDGSGLDLLPRLTAQASHPRVVVMSGLANEETIREARQRGASEYLTKPFDLDQCFHAAMGLETVDLTVEVIEPEALAALPVAVARQYQAVPVRVHRGVLEVAMADPSNVRLVDEISTLVGRPIKPLAVSQGDIEETIRRSYGVGAGVQSTRPSSDTAGTVPGGEAGIASLINDLVSHAYANRASDLHLGLGNEGPWIQERIDGMLCDVPVSTRLGSLYASIVSRMKVMAGLDIAEHRLPQDGRIWFEQGEVQLDLRVSVLPTLRGESLVIRLLEPSRVLGLAELGMTAEQLKQVESLLTKPTGLMLITGPTGSGKTTSLYAFLTKLNTGRRSIVTIEDPIEHELARARQIQVQSKVGLTFSTGLRSILRHDPDIIMVGEIRDQETASLGVRAALTGHQVLSTLHTNDAFSGITRLFDLGIEPFLLCSTLSGILSQRLLRRLCTECRVAVQIDVTTLNSMGLSIGTLSPMMKTGPVQMWRGKGCRRCRGTGYYGRTAVFEVLTVDHHIRSLIIKRTSSVQIRQSALSQGTMSLWQSGWQKIVAAETSLEELLRVLPSELH